MLRQGTDINIRRLNTHIDMDVEKAFYTVEWGYLWKVLSSFGFGPWFMS